MILVEGYETVENRSGDRNEICLKMYSPFLEELSKLGWRRKTRKTMDIPKSRTSTSKFRTGSLGVPVVEAS